MEVSKLLTQKLHKDRFDLKELNNVKGKYQVKTSEYRLDLHSSGMLCCEDW
jgi:hypothetical protein